MKLNTSTALNVVEIQGGLRVAVPAECTGFRDYLEKNGHKVSALGSEKYKVKEWKVGEDGKAYAEEVWLAHEFTTDAAFDDMPKLFADWFRVV